MAETPNNQEFTFDTGRNATQLGWGFLFFQYVWPVIIFFIGLALLIYFWPQIKPYLRAPQLPQAPQIIGTFLFKI